MTCPNYSDPLTNYAEFLKKETTINRRYQEIVKSLAPYPTYQKYFEEASAEYFCSQFFRIQVKSELHKIYRSVLKQGPANVLEKYPSATKLEKFFEGYSTSTTGVTGSRSSFEQISPHLASSDHLIAMADHIAPAL